MATGTLVADGVVATVATVVASEAELPPLTGITPDAEAPATVEFVIADPLIAERDGVVTREFFDDYYNRIHVVPTTLSFGMITADSTAPVQLWNAHLRAEVTLASISVPSGSAATLIGSALPLELSPLAVATYNVRVPRSGGAPSFNGDIIFGFGVDGTARVNISGVRARLWPAAPNWSNTYKITYAFKTEIIVSASGREQRSALRRTPRKIIEYTATMRDGDLRAAKDRLWGRQHLGLVIPEAPRFTTLAAPMASGAQELTVVEAPAWLMPGGMIVLSDGVRSESFAVREVDGAVVTTVAIAEMDWAAGARVYYGLGGYLAASLSSSRPSSL